MVLAIVFAALLVLLEVFQLALVSGAPWGRFAWGGRHEGTLPAAVEHQQEQSIRFGDYAVNGIIDGGVLRVTGATADGVTS